MAENTDEEHLNIPTNTQSKNPSEEVTPAEDTETITQNQEIENMEVHHHPDLHHKPKKWKEYLLEFLMIFLAVTMGFIAENIREHFVDAEREHQYIEAFVRDLKSDTASINRAIQSNLRKGEAIDSLLFISNSDLAKPEISKKFIYYFLKGTGIPTHTPNNSSITQLFNTGSLRLVSHRQGVVDSILKYDAFNKVILKHNDAFWNSLDGVFESFYPIADFKILKDTSYANFFQKTMTDKQTPPLHLTQEKLNIFLGQETRHSLFNEVNRRYLENQLQRAIRLINFLKKEYHLE